MSVLEPHLVTKLAGAIQQQSNVGVPNNPGSQGVVVRIGTITSLDFTNGIIVVALSGSQMPAPCCPNGYGNLPLGTVVSVACYGSSYYVLGPCAMTQPFYHAKASLNTAYSVPASTDSISSAIGFDTVSYDDAPSGYGMQNIGSGGRNLIYSSGGMGYRFPATGYYEVAVQVPINTATANALYFLNYFHYLAGGSSTGTGRYHDVARIMAPGTAGTLTLAASYPVKAVIGDWMQIAIYAGGSGAGLTLVNGATECAFIVHQTP